MSIYEPPIDPPDEPLACTWCEGDLVVDVVSVETALGTRRIWDPGRDDLQLECPHCQGSGDEPEVEPDPDRQRDEAREE